MAQNDSLYIITGATGGLGRAVSVALALDGKPLVLACRNVNAAAIFARELIAKTGNEDISVLKLDLASFEGVRSFVADLKELNRPVAALINNAGVMTRDSRITTDGFEQTVQVNYLSTALLSILTAPLIEIGGRIVFTTSLTRLMSRIPEQFPYESNFSQLGTYGRSKLAITLFAVYLTTVLKTSGILVECADPGIVNTNMITLNRWFDRIADVVFRPIISTPSEGAQSTLKALEATESGLIFHGDETKRVVSILKDKNMFVNLLNNTLRILNKEKAK